MADVIISIGCEIASWVRPWMACTVFFVEKYGWPFEEIDIDKVAKRILKNGLIFTANGEPLKEKRDIPPWCLIPPNHIVRMGII